MSRKISIYAILHFLVDFCCAFLLLRMAEKVEAIYLCFLIYNFCAFALQMPVGLLADKWNHNSLVAAGGCFLTGIAGILFYIDRVLDQGNSLELLYLMMVILAGAGNCLFHIGGGIEVINEGKDRLTPLGVFVSPGAIGIFLGTRMGRGAGMPELVPFALLLLSGFFLLWWNRKKGTFRSENVPTSGSWEYDSKIMIITLFCFFAVVVLRSHLGMIFGFSWKQTVSGAVWALLAVVSGKTAGGILADRIGLGKAIVVSMAAATVCMGVAENAFFGCLGLFLFNMSMPMTLYLAAKVLNKCKGFAFGILTFAIFIGFLPAYFGYRRCSEELLVMYSLLSGLVLLTGWLLQDKYTGKKDIQGKKEDA